KTNPRTRERRPQPRSSSNAIASEPKPPSSRRGAVDEERGVEAAARAGAGDVEGHDGAGAGAEEVAVELQVLREFTRHRVLVVERAPIHDAVADVGFAVFQRWLDE